MTTSWTFVYENSASWVVRLTHDKRSGYQHLNVVTYLTLCPRAQYVSTIVAAV